MSTSMKTTVMLLSLVAALASVGVLSRDREGTRSPMGIARRVAAGIAGLATIPLALGLFFYTRGAWPQLLYGVVSHNVLQGFDWWEGGAARLALFPIALPLLWWGGRRVVRGGADPSRGARRGVVFLANGIYATVLLGAWPVLTRQDFLPFFPLLVITVTPAILSIARRAGRPDRSPGGVPREIASSLAPGLAAAIQIAVLLALAPLSADGTKEEIALLKDVLRLTDRGQPVIDLKGETIFRPRPSFYVFEKLTNERFSRGDIEDRIPEALVASGTCVAVRHGQLFPPRARAFLDANFLRVGHLRVAGRWLTSGGSGATKPVAFDVAIPARYAIVAQGGAVTGLLDGVPYAGPRDLREGPHVYESHGVVGETALIWAQAVERGYGPRFGGRRAGEANGRAAGASPRRSEAASW
jgi:hypothetical protein